MRISLASVVVWLPFAAVLAGLPRAARAEVKIGYVDLQTALAGTEDGKAAQKQLKEIFNQKQKQLDDATSSLKAEQEDLERQQAVLRPEALKEREQALQKEYVDLQSTYMKLQKEISDKEQELTKPILARMQKLVLRIAADEGFSVILDKQAVLWAPEAADITSELVRRYNAGK